FLFLLRRVRHTPSSTLFPYTTLFRSQVYGLVQTAGLSTATLIQHTCFSQCLEEGDDLRTWCTAGLSTHDSGILPLEVRTQATPRSEEHTSELQSRRDLVCRLLLEKKK